MIGNTVKSPCEEAEAICRWLQEDLWCDRPHTERMCQLQAKIQVSHEEREADRQRERNHLVALLAEVGMLLNAIRARDGAPYYDARYHQGHTAYMEENEFYTLVERIEGVLGGDILRAWWETHGMRGDAHGGTGHP